MRCDQCGSPNSDNNNFCGSCGKRLVFVPMPSFARMETPTKISTGKALSTLGVRDIHDAEPEPPLPPPVENEVQPPVPLLSDPIKPASYLADITLPELPDHPEVSEPKQEFGPRYESRPVRIVESSFEPEPVRVVERNEPTTISGPSFLGLTTGSDSDDSSYLLEDDQPSHRGGWFLFALIMIAIFAGIGYMEWNTIKSGKINIPFLKSTSDQPSSSAAAPQPSTPQPSTTNSTTPTTPPTPDASAAAQPSFDKSADKPLISDENKPADTKSDDDTAATESAQNRQAQEAQQKKTEADQAAKATDTTASSNNSKSADAEQVPEPPAKHNVAAAPKRVAPAPKEVAEVQPDPRQNPMLIRGEKFLYGRGVPRNCQQAMVYFHAAAEDNNAPAMSHLAAMYNTGECVKQDRVSAYSWLRRAHDADPGNQWIAKNMNMVWRDMSAHERASIRR
jgi:hypothetical protein